MGFLKRLIMPWKDSYTDEDFEKYASLIVDLYFFAERNFPEVLDTPAKRIYGAYYVTLLPYIQGRPFVPGEDLAMQVMESFQWGSRSAQRLKVQMDVWNVLSGCAQVHGYATMMMMRTYRVSPARARQMGFYEDCCAFICESEFFKKNITEAGQRVRDYAFDETKAAKLAENFSAVGARCKDPLSMIKTSHFTSKSWPTLEEFADNLLCGRIRCDME